MKILTLDPGISNFAFCLAHTNGFLSTTPPSIIETGLFKGTFRDFDNEIFGALSLAVIEFFDHTEMFRGDVLLAERYTYRGGFGGAAQNRLVEPIGIMLGVFLHEAKRRGIEVHYITASTWKGDLKRRGVDWQIIRESRRGSKNGPLRFGNNVHERDCMGMLTYRWLLTIREVARAHAQARKRARGGVRTRAK